MVQPIQKPDRIRRLGYFAISAMFIVLFFGREAHAQTSERVTKSLAEFDQKVLAELQAQNPAAVGLFKQANESRKTGDHKRAAGLYAGVYEMAPGFVHALRRECSEEAELGNRTHAIELCQQALKQDRSAENLAALALVLVQVKPGIVPSPSDNTAALSLASQAAVMKPDDFFVQYTLCIVAMRTQDLAAFQTGVAGLERVAPEEVVTPTFGSLLALAQGRSDDAERLADMARKRGLPEESYKALLADIHPQKPVTTRLLTIAGLVGAGWLAGLGLLLLAGWLLSRAALRAASRVVDAPDGTARGLDARLRSLYRIVLWLCCGYYYISLPIVGLIVLVAGGGIIYGFLVLGEIPIKLVVIVALVTLATLWAIVRSLFIRGKDPDPGLRLTLDDHPKFAALLSEVAGGVGTRPVDSVYMTPFTEVAVMERGGMLRQLAGRRERCLILGAGVLEGMKIGPFKAILAHEYGHLSNRDTAGGGLALAVRRSLTKMAQTLGAHGAATWYNPAWLFLNGFHRIFLRISLGASRLQEVLADRWAAVMYGATAFEEGLRHVIERSVRFDAHVNAAVKEVIHARGYLPNVYAYHPTKGPSDSDLERAVQTALDRQPTPYDSHPSPNDRFAWVKALPTQGSRSSPDDAMPVWSLFGDRQALEREMTDKVRGLVLTSHGIDIPAEPAAPRAAASPLPEAT